MDAKFPDPVKYVGWYILFFFTGLITTVLWSIGSYVLMEKASIDSRRVFKNKYAK